MKQKPMSPEWMWTRDEDKDYCGKRSDPSSEFSCASRHQFDIVLPFFIEVFRLLPFKKSGFGKLSNPKT